MPLPFRSRRGLVTAAVVTAVAVGPLSLLSTQLATAAPPLVAAPPPIDRTSPLEARRVDRVNLPPIEWSSCAKNGAECARIRLPLDYDEPNGPTTTVFVGRLKAAKPEQRIGTLFVNPGGPGSSAAEFAVAADQLFGRQILDRFDIVGVDPRGVGYGDKVTCFTSAADQQATIQDLDAAFPVTPAETEAYLRASLTYATGCGTTGGPLAASMSTAQVARDMDVVRRTLGEKTLTFFGGSYGTFLGQVYANMFPDRVRAMSLDGLVDPVAQTTGRGNGRAVPMEDRRRAADGAYTALRELMRRCDKVGAPTCAFAGSGDSLKKFDVLAQRVKKTPVTFQNRTITYPSLVKSVLDGMYESDVGPKLTTFLQDVYTASDPAVIGAPRASAASRAVAGSAALRATVRPDGTLLGGSPRAEADAPYDYSSDAYLSIKCSDSLNPTNPQAWIAAGEAADRRAPYFGSLWSWVTAPCAGSIWTARDEDRYLGPFTKRTANPVLMIGNYYDPSTPYTYGAVAASKLLPNSRLLTSDSWGHTAFFNNPCVSSTVEAYLVNGTLPATGMVCTGPQPFEQTATPQSTRPSRSTVWSAPVR